MIPKKFHWQGIWRCTLIVALAAPAARATAQVAGWATGPELQQRLAENASVSWSSVPLGRALKSMSRAQHVAIVLDRRVDPEIEMRVVLSTQPLRDCLRQASQHARIGYSQVGSVAYFGPPEMVAKIRTLAELRSDDAKQLPSAAMKKMLALRNSHWDDLAEPKDLFRQLAGETGVELEGLERVPHDLWPAADLPPLTWVDRMTLLAAQFDLTYRFKSQGRQVELIPCPKTVALSRTYQAGGNAAELITRWSKNVPSAKLSVEGEKIRVVGTLEDHELIQQRLRGTPTRSTTTKLGAEQYNFTVENASLAAVVDHLSGRLNLEFSWNRAAIDAAGVSVEQLVTVKVQDASLDELLKAVFNGTGLGFTRKDHAVSIDVGPKP